MHRRIQTFKPRRGRYSKEQVAAITSSAYLVELHESVPLSKHFSSNRVILDIGFGMGDATAEQARAHPEVGILAIDVHTPGVGRLLALLEQQQLTNVRVIEGDALTLLHDVLPDRSIVGVRAYFPDPWPKKKHHKRRIINAEHLDVLARKLVPGGFLHFATDWQDYAETARTDLHAHPAFDLLPEGAHLPLASRAERPRTKFEMRGIAAGRSITDLIAVRKD
jgi:tRNA (guanine-N7-)-methyltransferase